MIRKNIVDLVCGTYLIKGNLTEFTEFAENHFRVTDLQHFSQNGGFICIIFRYALLNRDAVNTEDCFVHLKKVQGFRAQAAYQALIVFSQIARGQKHLIACIIT